MNFVCACGSAWVVERFRVAGMHLLDVTQDVSPAGTSALETWDGTCHVPISFLRGTFVLYNIIGSKSCGQPQSDRNTIPTTARYRSGE